MRTPLIAGNWKMNGSTQRTQQLISSLCSGVADDDDRIMLLCPPYPYLHIAAEALKSKAIMLGAQNIAMEPDSGAYTGEVSGLMLKNFGCEYVIVGHSERRALYGETNEVVSNKFIIAQAQGLQPILCVGETLEERELGQTQAVVRRQIQKVIDSAGSAAFSSAVIAYEPVWAIGTGLTATPDQAQETHSFIRSLISEQDATIASLVQIIYGGSMKSENAKELLSMDDVDGGLVGGASLNAEEFLAIFQAA
ncbi:MAG: triose-phosphate isomerase [Gammaproteobacteria bacterium]|nr:triose-phosphate isomerase [Gammaproteobacteria bacterium]